MKGARPGALRRSTTASVGAPLEPHPLEAGGPPLAHPAPRAAHSRRRLRGRQGRCRLLDVLEPTEVRLGRLTREALGRRAQPVGDLADVDLVHLALKLDLPLEAALLELAQRVEVPAGLAGRRLPA